MYTVFWANTEMSALGGSAGRGGESRNERERCGDVEPNDSRVRETDWRTLEEIHDIWMHTSKSRLRWRGERSRWWERGQKLIEPDVDDTASLFDRSEDKYRVLVEAR
jgi:hypothetical protein